MPPPTIYIQNCIANPRHFNKTIKIKGINTEKEEIKQTLNAKIK